MVQILLHRMRQFQVIILGLLFSFQAFGQQYNVRDYGAISDTTRLSTDAINRAIQACHAAGGGRVFVPAGNYKSGTITLMDNVELYLDRGCILYGSTNPKDYPRQKQPEYRSQKDPGGWFALIYAEGATNIGIGGHGTIDGQGSAQRSRPELLGGDRDGRPRNILFISCKKVSVDGVTMMNSGMWNQHYLNCEDVLVNNIHVYNHSNKNNDGIDIDGCRRFVLSNSVIDSDDDGIVLKSTGPAGCEDVSIANCIVSSYTNAIKLGTESTGGFKNIAISNCVVKPTRSTEESKFRLRKLGITGLSLEIVDGGILNGVTVDNIVMEGTQCPIYVRLGNRARKYMKEAPELPLGQMKNIRISDITAYNTGNFSSSITGVPGASIDNIALANITFVNTGGLTSGEYLADFSQVKEEEKGYPQPTVWKNLPSYGFFIRHVKHVSLDNIELRSIAPDPRVPIIGVDIDELFVRNLVLDRGNPHKEIVLHEVREFDIDDKPGRGR